MLGTQKSPRVSQAWRRLLIESTVVLLETRHIDSGLPDLHDPAGRHVYHFFVYRGGSAKRRWRAVDFPYDPGVISGSDTESVVTFMFKGPDVRGLDSFFAEVLEHDHGRADYFIRPWGGDEGLPIHADFLFDKIHR